MQRRLLPQPQEPQVRQVPEGRHVRRHDGPALLDQRGTNRVSQIGILRRRRSPGGKGHLLRPLGPRRPHLLPLSFPTGLHLFAAQGGGDLGLADPGVDCAPLFTAFRGASATGAAFCFRLKKQHKSEEREKQKINGRIRNPIRTSLGGQPSSGSLELLGGLPKHQGPLAGAPTFQRMAQGPRRWSRSATPPPSRRPPLRTPGEAQMGPPALSAAGALRIRPPTPFPSLGNPRGLSPPEGRCHRRLQ